MDSALSRRSFLKATLAGTLAVSGSFPARAASPESRILLKNGLVIDGSGSKGFRGHLLLAGGTIEDVSTGGVAFEGVTVDCTGKVIAPGFIDLHAHTDWVMPAAGYDHLRTPYTLQGITTFVGGNCGFGIAGFEAHTKYDHLLNLASVRPFDREWDSMAEFFDYMRSAGLSHNLAVLSGHGMTRTSMRGHNPEPLSAGEMKRLTELTGAAMDEGALGLSFGLQYAPGLYATHDEIVALAREAKVRDKLMSVHMKAFSVVSGAYPFRIFGSPHNLRALEDMLLVARETGVRLQLSHLLFVGTRTWRTLDTALALIDGAIEEGLDVKFDTFPYFQGMSYIDVILPPWFVARGPAKYRNRRMLRKLRIQFALARRLIGFDWSDFRLSSGNHNELNQYNGLRMDEIARKRGLSNFENFMDFAEKSEGTARILFHRFNNREIVETLIRHPASLFMTDAVATPDGIQNPAAYGTYPRFFQMIREGKLILLEDAVYKMTGGPAERAKISKRGFLRRGYAADVTVFDPVRIRDNNMGDKTDATPSGIEHVFINGFQAVRDGKADGASRPGLLITS